MLLILAASFGLLLVVLPGWALEQYDKVSEAGTVWVYVYFGVVGTGALLLIISTSTVFFRGAPAAAGPSPAHRTRAAGNNALAAPAN